MSPVLSLKMSGPNSTAIIMRMKTTVPAIARRWRRYCRHASPQSERTRRLTSSGAADAAAFVILAALVIANPRIQDSVQHIGNQVKDHDQNRVGKGDCQYDGGIAIQDRANLQFPDARHAEDLFGDNCSGKDGRNAER